MKCAPAASIRFLREYNPTAAGQAGRSLRTSPRFDFGLDMSHSKYESFQARLSFVVICWQSRHW